MHDEAGTGDNTLDRRSLIKKVGVAGAVAWTAPVVLDSVLSPAAAESVEGPTPGPPPAFLFRETWINVDANSAGPNFYVTYTDGLELDSTGWIVTGPTVASVDAITVPNYGSGGFSTARAIELGGSPTVVGGVAGGITRAVSLPLAGNYTISVEWANPSTTSPGTFSLTGGAPAVAYPLGVSATHDTYVDPFNMAAPGIVTLTFNGSGSDNSGPIIGLVEIVYTGP